MSTDDTHYEADRQTIRFRPEGYGIRAFFPLLFVGAGVYLIVDPGQAKQSTVFQACVLLAVLCPASWIYFTRHRVDVDVKGLILTRVMNQVTVKWEDVRVIHSGLFGCFVTETSGERFVVWGVLHRTRFDALLGRNTSKDVVAWIMRLARTTPGARVAEIQDGVPYGSL